MRKKKVFAAAMVLAAAVAVSFTGCGGSKSETAEKTEKAVTEAAVQEEAAKEAETTAAEETSAADQEKDQAADQAKDQAKDQEKDQAEDQDFTGTWGARGGRYGIEFSKAGDVWLAVEGGSGGASTSIQETMTCQMNGDRLEYSDGTMTVHEFGGDGSEAEITEFTDGKGQFFICPYDEGAKYLDDMSTEYSLDVFAREWDGEGDSFRAADQGSYLIWIQEPVEKYASQEYVFWYSSQIPIPQGAADFLSDEDKRIARNEIYARHGRKFSAEDLQQHFNSCSWYEGTVEPDQFDESVLSEVEKLNIDMLSDGEQAGSGAAADAAAQNHVDPEGEFYINGERIPTMPDMYPDSYYHSVMISREGDGWWFSHVTGRHPGSTVISEIRPNVPIRYELEYKGGIEESGTFTYDGGNTITLQVDGSGDVLTFIRE